MREEHGLPQDRDAERGETANRVDDPSATQAMARPPISVPICRLTCRRYRTRGR